MTDGFDGNEGQLRKIATQLFEVWETQRGDPPKKVGSVPAWGALAISVGTLIWGSASVSSDVANNTRRVDQVETVQRQQDAGNAQLLERMARIEAKLDIVLEEKKP